jgi:urease accessory protein UreF
MPDDTPRPGDRLAAARTIAEQAQELSRLARRHGLDSLAFVLDVAAMTAEEQYSGDRPPDR